MNGNRSGNVARTNAKHFMRERTAGCSRRRSFFLVMKVVIIARNVMELEASSLKQRIIDFKTTAILIKLEFFYHFFPFFFHGGFRGVVFR